MHALNLSFYYIILTATIALGLGGFIVFVVGLSQKKKRFLVSGIGALSIALILCIITVIRLYQDINKPKNTIIPENTLTYKDYFENTHYYFISGDFKENPRDHFKGSLLSSVQEDHVISIKIDNDIVNKGLGFHGLAQPLGQAIKNGRQILSFYIEFNKSFKGLLQLKLFDEFGNPTDSCLVELSQQKGQKQFVDFKFMSHKNLLQSEFGLLKLEEL